MFRTYSCPEVVVRVLPFLSSFRSSLGSSSVERSTRVFGEWKMKTIPDPVDPDHEPLSPPWEPGFHEPVEGSIPVYVSAT